MPSLPAWNRKTIHLIAALLLFGGSSRGWAADAPDLEDLRPGLLAVYRDAVKPKATEIVRLEPAVALVWKVGEAAHPRLAADGTAEWTGYLNVLRAGEYHFGAMLRGAVRVRIDGKEVLSADVKTDAPAIQTGAAVRLESGVHALAVEFIRPAGEARLELLWQGPQFKSEPLPHDVLFHLPAKAPAKLAADRLVERGRFLAEEHSCAACHKPDAKDRIGKGLSNRQGPDLSQVGSRVHAGWFYHWLLAPEKVRPGAAMPHLFGENETGRTEAYAVARYLASLRSVEKNQPRPPNPNELKASINAGQRLFTSLGCIACHNENAKKSEETTSFHLLAGSGARRNFPLGSLGSKTTAEHLGKYLLNPLAIDPSGRMPDMALQAKEAIDLSRFLCASKDQTINEELPPAPAEAAMLAAFQQLEPDAEKLTAFKKLPAEKQWLDLGQRLAIAKNCVACHTIAPNKKPLAGTPAKALFADLAKFPMACCLANDPADRGKAPGFDLKPTDLKALRAFLAEGTKGAASAAPAYTARVTIQRFNCLACHSRDGEGGLTPEIIEELRRHEKAENAEAVSPPPLTGVGHKLRTAWLREVLTQRGRARPWMGLRMPQFGEKINDLPATFAALEGTVPDDAIHKVPLDTAKIAAGRQLIGKTGFGCISCHDIAGNANTGTRGPDMALMNNRVRFDWYLRWLEQAQRMQPGTRMPTVFPEGKSTLTNILAGKPDAQAEAMWAYLSLGMSLPLPEGLEPLKGKGIPLRVADKPMLLRTFMPDAGTRAIAIGFPGGVSTAFDAATCRLAFAWSGSFLDASPVWDGRGGTPAKLLGTKFWNAPPGCPWGVNDSNEPPDFAAQNKDLGWGAPLPANTVYDGPRHLQFDGYTLDKDSAPTFNYRLDAASNKPVKVRERVEPLKNPAGYGVGRRLALDVPAQRGAWLLAGETTGKPRLLDAKGNAIDLELKSDQIEVPCANRMLVLPQGDRAIVVGTKTFPEGARWVLQKHGGTWQVLLHLPAGDKANAMKVGIDTWSPFRDEPGLLKELFAGQK